MDPDSLARALLLWLATIVAAPTGAFALAPPIALANEVKTVDLSVFFQWMQDGEVWEWLRVVFAALLGAVVGGFFTLSGQKREAKAQSKREARAQSIADLRGLFESFVKLGQDIDDAPRTMGHILGRPWRREWRLIWTRQRQNSFRSQAE
jgi:sugar phosphate isomerase/epimerase